MTMTITTQPVVPQLTVESPEIQEWLTGAQAIVNKQYKSSESPLGKLLVLKETRDYIVVFAKDTWDGVVNENTGSYFAFVVKSDKQNGKLGTVTRGDIMKCDGKTPAKTARGNLFDAHKGLKCVGPYGIAYLG